MGASLPARRQSVSLSYSNQTTASTPSACAELSKASPIHAGLAGGPARSRSRRSSAGRPGGERAEGAHRGREHVLVALPAPAPGPRRAPVVSVEPDPVDVYAGVHPTAGSSRRRRVGFQTKFAFVAPSEERRARASTRRRSSRAVAVDAVDQGTSRRSSRRRSAATPAAPRGNRAAPQPRICASWSPATMPRSVYAG